MQRRKFLKTVALSAATVPFLKYLPAQAASRDETLVVVAGNTINSLDLHRKGTNQPSYQVTVNIYDRLVRFGVKQLEDGSLAYDSTVIEPEVAESWVVSDDGKSITFKLNPMAKFWDGTPVTAADVKWSFDRAVSLGGFPAVQMKAGSMTKPEQFVVVDEMTFRIDLPAPSKLTIPDLAVPIPFIINSAVAKKNATESDPWATEYLHKNPAGSGAYQIARWDPGQQFVYQRNENWALGPKPGVKRVIVREVPSASTRRALLERGDADLYMTVPAKDAKEFMDNSDLLVSGAPIDNCMHVLALNLKYEPYDNIKVRQAIAHALPYEEIMAAAAYGRGKPMFGGTEKTPSTIEWPQPFPYSLDLEKAKSLLAEAGFASGFETTLSYNLGLAAWQEPTALLIQESLGKIGIKVTLDKIPGANWRTAALVEKKLPMHLENFGGWLNYPDYYFFWAYKHGHLFNSSNYKNDEVEALVDATLHMETDVAEYTENVKKMIAIAFEDVPRIPLYQPYLDSAMQSNVTGYASWFHRQLDVRSIGKALGIDRLMLLKLQQVAGRLLQAIPSVIGIIVISFALTRALPGDPTVYFAGAMADEASIEEVRKSLGLDRSWLEQLLIYARNLLRGDLGMSLNTGQPVLSELVARLPASLELTVLGLGLAVLIAAPLGILAATRPGSWVDHLCRVLVTAGVSPANFFHRIIPDLHFLLCPGLGAVTDRRAGYSLPVAAACHRFLHD